MDIASAEGSALNAGLRRTLALLQTFTIATNGIPVLNQLLSTIHRLLEVVESTQANQRKFKVILSDVTRIVRSLSSLKLVSSRPEIPEMMGYAQALWDFNEILKGIYAFALLCHNRAWWRRFLHYRSDEGVIQDYREKLNSAAQWLQIIQGHVTIQMLSNLQPT